MKNIRIKFDFCMRKICKKVGRVLFFLDEYLFLRFTSSLNFFGRLIKFQGFLHCPEKKTLIYSKAMQK